MMTPRNDMEQVVEERDDQDDQNIPIQEWIIRTNNERILIQIQSSMQANLQSFTLFTAY